MMKLIRTSLIAFAILLAAGCAKEYDDTALSDRIDDVQAQADANANSLKRLEKKVKEAVEKGMTVIVAETDNGYTLTFGDGTSITVNHGQDGEDGDRGPQGENGTDAPDTNMSVAETEDGYIITIDGNEYNLLKGKSFSFRLESTEMTLDPGATKEIPYTLTNPDATTNVYVRVSSGYTAVVDMASNKVAITAPAELPQNGFVVFTAVKTSTGEVSSQYVSFVSGTLDVVADAETVPSAGGLVTLTVTANCNYTVDIPESCTWIRQVESKNLETSYVYLQVDENTVEEARQATITLISGAGNRTVVIAQKAYKPVDPNAFNISPDDVAEKYLTLSEMTSEELDGQTIHFNSGTYNIQSYLQLGNVNITITGDDAVLSTGTRAFEFRGTNVSISGITFKECEQPIYISSGNLTIEDCNFTDNEASYGNIYMGGDVSVVIKNSSFSGNYAQSGADIYMCEGNLTLENCTFEGSESKYSGACLAMSCLEDARNEDFTKSKATIKNCTFTDIKPGTYFADNNPGDGPGGVISCVWGEVDIDGCTFDSCESSSGTIICLGSRVGPWAFYRGDNLLKMNNCVIKNCTTNRLGLIYLNSGTEGGDVTVDMGNEPSRRAIAFVNNTSFYNNTSNTGQYGVIAHSGGNGGIQMYNNCTIHNLNVPEDTEGGFTVNTDGYILMSNTTLMAKATSALLRNSRDGGAVKFVNSIGINLIEGGNFVAEAKDALGATTDGHCIIGPAYASGEFTDPIKDATTLDGYSWNATDGLVEWNGPADDFTKLSASDFKSQLVGFGPATPKIYSESSAGEAFYNWLEEIGAVGKDANGNSRGDSWWPGAYQK